MYCKQTASYTIGVFSIQQIKIQKCLKCKRKKCIKDQSPPFFSPSSLYNSTIANKLEGGAY